MKRVLTALVLVITAFTPGYSAFAANIQADAGSGDATIISIFGEIEAGDAETFRREAAQHGSAIVVLESPGGSTLDAIEIGEAIRLRGFSTVVINGSDCDSACALIWLAGSPRTITRSARVGFHASYIDDRGRQIESGVGNALVGRYLTLLNLPIDAIIFATQASPDQLTWLDASNFRNAGIETSIINDIVRDGPAETRSSAKPVVAAPPPITIAPPAAVRQETEYYGEAGSWLVMLDNTLAGSCFAVRAFNDGTILRITNDARYSFNDGEGYLMITNRSWASLEPGQEYALSIDLGFETPWNAKANVVTFGGFTWLAMPFNGESGQDFKNEFANARDITISRDGAYINQLDLQGSGEAVRLMGVCQAQANQNRAASDPFAD